MAVIVNVILLLLMMMIVMIMIVMMMVMMMVMMTRMMMCSRSQGKGEEAVTLLKDSIRFGPHFADAYSSLASLYAEQVKHPEITRTVLSHTHIHMLTHLQKICLFRFIISTCFFETKITKYAFSYFLYDYQRFNCPTLEKL